MSDAEKVGYVPAWMIKRVAKAICQSASCEGAQCCQWPANKGRTRCPVEAGGYDDAAKGALGVILEES